MPEDHLEDFNFHILLVYFLLGNYFIFRYLNLPDTIKTRSFGITKF